MSTECNVCEGRGWTMRSFMGSAQTYQTKCDSCAGEGHIDSPKMKYVDGRNVFSLSDILIPNVCHQNRQWMDWIDENGVSSKSIAAFLKAHPGITSAREASSPVRAAGSVPSTTENV